MKPTIKKRWLKALRSGEYDKTKGYLNVRTNDGHDKFCCLGVLVNITEGFDKVLKPCPHPDVDIKTVGAVKCHNNGYMTGMLTDKQLEKFGLDLDEARTLAAMNDSGKSFDKIANYIEKKL